MNENLVIQIITIKTISEERKNNLDIQLEKLKNKFPSIKTIIYKFDVCRKYINKSDDSKCVKRKLFENHQYCCRYLINSSYDYTLVLEDDIVFQEDFDKNLKIVLKWLNKNKTWDIFYGGIYNNFYENDLHANKLIKRAYGYFTHCIFYNKNFCKYFIKLKYKEINKYRLIMNGHFDNYLLWLSYFKKIKSYYIIYPIANQLDKKHLIEANLGYAFSINIYFFYLFPQITLFLLGIKCLIAIIMTRFFE